MDMGGRDERCEITGSFFSLLIFLFIVKVKKEKEEIEISAVTLLGTIGVLISGE